MADQVAQLLNQPRTVDIAGRTVEIREVTVANLSAFGAACEPFLDAFEQAGDLAEERRKQGKGYMRLLFRLMTRHTSAFMDAAVLVTNQPREFYEQLKPADFFQVCQLMVEVSSDFFIQQLAPSLVKLSQAANLTGLMLSLSSLQQDTVTPTASTTH